MLVEEQAREGLCMEMPQCTIDVLKMGRPCKKECRRASRSREQPKRRLTGNEEIGTSHLQPQGNEFCQPHP